MNASISLLVLLTIVPSIEPAQGQRLNAQEQENDFNGSISGPPLFMDLTNPAAPGFNAEDSDAYAIGLADATMYAMGGREAWDATRHLTWNFFGRRRHLWDRHTGDVRIEYEETQAEEDEQAEKVLILMNIHSGEGRAWRGGEEVTDPKHLEEMLTSGRSAWINDSYWLLMPFKLKDTGVTLKYLGERDMQDGLPADVLQLTFENVGDTPQNKYDVYVGKDSRLVEQWSFYRDASDAEPTFTTPWKDWRRHGRIMLSGDRGELRGQPARITEIAVFDDLAESVYTSPEDVNLPPEVDDK